MSCILLTFEFPGSARPHSQSTTDGRSAEHPRQKARNCQHEYQCYSQPNQAWHVLAYLHDRGEWICWQKESNCRNLDYSNSTMFLKYEEFILYLFFYLFLFFYYLYCIERNFDQVKQDVNNVKREPWFK
jgi:hypothetical protein